MTHSADHLLWGLISTAATAALMAVARNRAIRRRLRWTLGALAGYLLVHSIAWYVAPIDPATVSRFPQAPTLENLLLAFAVVNAGVALVFNPWFSDRIAFAGLAIQVDRPFKVGHWIRVGDFDGQVVEVTWRATKIRTKAGNMVILPNNIVEDRG